MLKSYPKLKKGKVEDIYKNIPSSEKKKIGEYLTYRRARGLNSEDKVKDVRRYILHLRHILQKDFKKITLKDYRNILAIINNSKLSSNTKNHIKVDFKNFLKFLFPDWSSKFYGFEDIRLDSSRNEEKINSKTIYSREDINKLIKHEPKLFWKTLLLVQYEGGLRTIEVRTLKWENISFNVDEGLSEVSVYSTKTKQNRAIFVKDSTPLLKRLKEEQENEGNKGIYVFNSKKNKNLPVTKYAVSVWFRRLSKRVLGKEGWLYLLRHSRATELYKLADENKISKDTAIRFMGHSKDMTRVYTHLDKQKVLEMLKNQVYKEQDLTPQEKDRIKELEKEIEELREGLGQIYETMTGKKFLGIKDKKLKILKKPKK